MGIIDQPDQERTSRSYCSMSQTTTSKQDRLTPPWWEGACTYSKAQSPLEYLPSTTYLCDMGPSAAKALISHCDSI